MTFKYNLKSEMMYEDSVAIDMKKDTSRLKKFKEFQSIIDNITYKPGWYFRTGIEENRMWGQIRVTKENEIASKKANFNIRQNVMTMEEK